MISLGAAVVRAVIKAYTYRYRKNLLHCPDPLF